MPYYCIIYCFTVYINKARNYVIKGAVFFVEVQQSPNASPLRHSSPQLCAQPPHNADCRASLLVTSRCLSHLPGRRAASSSAQGLHGRGKAGLPGLGFSLPSKLSASHFYALRAFGSLPAPCFLPCHRREPQIRLIWSDWSDLRLINPATRGNASKPLFSGAQRGWSHSPISISEKCA